MFVVRTSLPQSSIHGISVFADEPIQKGQIVWQFDPRVEILLFLEEKQNFPVAVQDYLSMRTYIEELSSRKMMVLCADNAKYVNPSDDPNLLDTPDGTCEYTARDIAIGEELTCNYFISDLEAARKLGQK